MLLMVDEYFVLRFRKVFTQEIKMRIGVIAR